MWLWREETGTAARFPLPNDAFDPRLSADHTLIAFRRAVDEHEQELWTMETDGRHMRKLATLSADDTLARYPEAVDVRFSHNWVRDTHLIAYTTHPRFDAIGEVPAETIRLVDADTGASRVAMPPGEVNAMTYAPDGSQLAALTTEELRLANCEL